jgi:hypothetical protein
MGRRRISPEKVAGIVKLYQQDVGMRAIAKIVNVAYGTVNNVVTNDPRLTKRGRGSMKGRPNPHARATTKPLARGSRAAVLLALRGAHPQARTRRQLCDEARDNMDKTGRTLMMAEARGLVTRHPNTGEGDSHYVWTLTNAGVAFVDALPPSAPQPQPDNRGRRATNKPLGRGFRAQILLALRRTHPKPRTMRQLVEETCTTAARAFSTLTMAEGRGLITRQPNTGVGRSRHVWMLTDEGVAFVDDLPQPPADNGR